MNTITNQTTRRIAEPMVGNEFSDADLFLNAYLSKNAVPPTSNTVFQNTSNTVFQNNDQEELEACKVAVGSSSSYNDISQYAHISSNGSISIAVIGDSLAAKEGFLLPGSDYPSHLKDILSENGWNVDMLNLGEAAQTTEYGLIRAGEIAERVIQKPDVVVLELGGNDVILYQKDPKEIKQNLEETIQILQREGITVMLAGIEAPPNFGDHKFDNQYREEFKNIYPDLANKYDLIYTPMVYGDIVKNESAATLKDIFHSACMDSDFIHANYGGARIMAEGMVANVVDAIIKSQGVKLPDKLANEEYLPIESKLNTALGLGG